LMRQLKYASGMTFNRIEDLQKKLGVPLPESTQWKLVRDTAELMKPVHSALNGHYRIFTGLFTAQIWENRPADRTGLLEQSINNVPNDISPEMNSNCSKKAVFPHKVCAGNPNHAVQEDELNKQRRRHCAEISEPIKH